MDARLTRGRRNGNSGSSLCGNILQVAVTCTGPSRNYLRQRASHCTIMTAIMPPKRPDGWAGWNMERPTHYETNHYENGHDDKILRWMVRHSGQRRCDGADDGSGTSG